MQWYAHIARGNNPQTFSAPTDAEINESERLPIVEGPFDSQEEADEFISDWIDNLRKD